MGIVEKIIGIVFLVPSTMLSTVSALSAQNVGAGNHDRAEPMVGLFTNDAAAVLLGGQYLRGYIWDCIFAGIHFSFSGYFCAYGWSGISFLHNSISIVCARIPGAYLASKHFPDTLFPMGLAAPAGSLLSVIICVTAYVLLKQRMRNSN